MENAASYRYAGLSRGGKIFVILRGAALCHIVYNKTKMCTGTQGNYCFTIVFGAGIKDLIGSFKKW